MRDRRLTIVPPPDDEAPPSDYPTIPSPPPTPTMAPLMAGQHGRGAVFLFFVLSFLAVMAAMWGE